MKPIFILLALLAAGPAGAQTMASIKPLPYPGTRKVDTTTTYFGTKVADPYRWLENDQAADTKAWVQEENKVTQDYLSKIPFRESIRQRLTKLWNYERYSRPTLTGDYLYFFVNTGLKNQAVLYRQLGSTTPEVFLDPNTFSEDGTTSLADIDFSSDGSLAACQTSESGSDWRSIFVLNTSDKTTVGDTLRNINLQNLAWKGNEGFYYSSYDKPAAGKVRVNKLYYHQLNTPQTADQLVFDNDGAPDHYFVPSVTEDGRFLIISEYNSTPGNKLYLQDLSQPASPIVTIVPDYKSRNIVLGNVADKIYLHTNYASASFRVVSMNVAKPTQKHWHEVIPATHRLGTVTLVGGKLFATISANNSPTVEQFSLAGQSERLLRIPEFGSISGFTGKAHQREVYYTFTSYALPPIIVKYSIATGKSTLCKIPPIQFDPSKYESKQVFCTSKDGTQIPLTLTYKKGLALTGKNPTLLYGYGGFNSSVTPGFSTSNIILMEQGGIYAVANLRGDGGYDEKWHEAGTKLHKQNVFDDFIAAAEFLKANKYTDTDHLAISGASNGGLLVGATITQRPDLCKVAFPAVGVMDMLRYNQFTAGAGWAYDYGTAQDSPEMFRYLYQYSPYHALKPASYPATMITTADHDDRVVPAHSFKFASRLQEMQQGPAPVLIRIETKAGHGAGRSTAQVIGEQVDKWAFLFENMGVNYAAVQ